MTTISKLAAAFTGAAILTAQAFAQNATGTAEEQTGAPAVHHRVIVVSLEDRKLALVEDGQVLKVYPVAIGKPATPSPVGTFTVKSHVKNPTYSHDGRVILPGPGNPVGTRWMGLSLKGYGIHGTNEPKSIGKAASHGCIRMAKADLEELFPMVMVGDTVELVGQRDEQTAQLFGNGDKPAAMLAATSAPAAQTQPAATSEAAQTAGAEIAGTL